MSKCRIGLAECRYGDKCFKNCDTCVRQKFEEEIRCMEQNAYNQGWNDAIDECIKRIDEIDIIESDWFIDELKKLKEGK